MDFPTPVDVAVRPFELNEKEARVLVESDNTCATTLALIAQVLFGPTVWEVESSDVIAAIENAFDCDMSASSENKLHALHIAVTTPRFYTDKVAFVAMCDALADGDPVDSIEGLLNGDIEVPALLWGMWEVDSFLGEDAPSYAGDVVSFVLSQMREESGEKGADEFPLYLGQYIAEKKADLRSELLRIGVPPATVDEVTS